jgi:hypothetical protein
MSEHADMMFALGPTTWSSSSPGSGFLRLSRTPPEQVWVERSHARLVIGLAGHAVTGSIEQAAKAMGSALAIIHGPIEEGSARGRERAEEGVKFFSAPKPLP